MVPGESHLMFLLSLLTGYGVDDLSPYEMSFSPRSIPQATRAKLLTQELCDAAFEESVDKDISVILRVMPARFKTEKMCRQALRLNAELYEFFPPSMMTDELWKIVLKKKPDVITEIRQPSIEDVVAHFKVVICRDVVFCRKMGGDGPDRNVIPFDFNDTVIPVQEDVHAHGGSQWHK